MANTKISDLSAGAAVSATDVLPNVQTTGVGPVKTTAAQLKTFMSASPTLVTPTLGVATATTINKVALTAPATGSTLTIADGKTLTASNTLTFTGTDASSVAFGTGGTVLYSGGALGTPSSGTLTNATGLPISTGVSGLGANVATWLATPSSANLAAAVSDETGTGALVFANSPTFTDDITLGAQQTTQGSIILANTAAGAYATTLQSSNSATAAWTLTLPTTAGTNGYVLSTNGAGVTSWIAASGSPAGSNTQIQYNNSGSFGADSGLAYNSGTGYLLTEHVASPSATYNRIRFNSLGKLQFILGPSAEEYWVQFSSGYGGDNAGIKIKSSGNLGFTSAEAYDALDTMFSRSSAGIMALRGSSSTSPAGFNFYTYGASPPSAPSASMALLYADTSGGKIRLMAIFPSGAAQQIAIEP